MELPKVEVSMPVTDTVSDFEAFTGRFDAIYTVEIRARVTGYLDKVHFEDGNEVNEGDLLFEIDPRPYETELNRTEANVVQAEAHQHRLEADQRRANSLYSRGAIGREEFDRIIGDYSEAQAAVSVSKAARDMAKLSSEFTKVKAPISGRLSRRLVDPGNLVQADVTPLTTIVSLDPLYVYFEVDERTLLRLRRLVREGKIKSRAEAVIPILVGLADEVDETGEILFPHSGEIDFSDNKVDPATGTLQLRGKIANPKSRGGTRVLSPGLVRACPAAGRRPPRGDLDPGAGAGAGPGAEGRSTWSRRPRTRKSKMVDKVHKRPVDGEAVQQGSDGHREGTEGRRAGRRQRLAADPRRDESPGRAVQGGGRGLGREAGDLRRVSARRGRAVPSPCGRTSLMQAAVCTPERT